jgi:hypothetical protein
MSYKHSTVDFRICCLHGDLGMQNCRRQDSDPRGQKLPDPGHCFLHFFIFCQLANCDSRNSKPHVFTLLKSCSP